MLIKFLGAGDSPRSYIEPLQRYVSVGETVKTKDGIAQALLQTGRWQKATDSPPAGATPDSHHVKNLNTAANKRRNNKPAIPAPKTKSKHSEVSK